MEIKDKEYIEILSDLLNNKDVLELQNFEHHKITNRLNHSIEVSYKSYKLGKKMRLKESSLKEVARAGLLHDFFFYDTKTSDVEKHLRTHPELALENANKIFELTDKEKDIILSHMFLVSFKHIPKYKESYIVSMVDKAVSIQEVYTLSKTLINSFSKSSIKAYNK